MWYTPSRLRTDGRPIEYSSEDAASMQTVFGRLHSAPSVDSAYLMMYSCLGSPGCRPHLPKHVYHMRQRPPSRSTAVDPSDRCSSSVRGRMGAREKRRHGSLPLFTARPTWFWNGVRTVGIKPT